MTTLHIGSRKFEVKDDDTFIGSGSFKADNRIIITLKEDAST